MLAGPPTPCRPARPERIVPIPPPSSARADTGWATRAALLLQLGRVADAERVARGWLAQAPSDPHAHALLAVCLARQGQDRAAVAAAEEAVGLAPDEPEPYSALAEALASGSRRDPLPSARLDAAETAAREAVRLAPRDADLLAQLAAIRLALGRTDRAIEATDAALAVEPTHPLAAAVRARCLVGAGDRAGADAVLSKALGANPSDPDLHAARGWLALEAGRPTEAVACFRAALMLDAGATAAREGLLEALRARRAPWRALLRWQAWYAAIPERAGTLLDRVPGRLRLLAGVLSLPLLVAVACVPLAVLLAVVWVALLVPPAAPLLVVALGAFLFDPLRRGLGNLVLWARRPDRLVLSGDERRGCRLVSALLVPSAALSALVPFVSALIPSVAAGGELLWLALLLAGLALVTVATFACAEGWPRQVTGTATVALGALVGAGAVALAAWHAADRPDALGELAFWSWAAASIGCLALLGIGLILTTVEPAGRPPGRT
jgi:Flp pilus assembly protein TadD